MAVTALQLARSRLVARRNAERSVDHLQERPLLAQDEPLRLGHREVGAALGIFPESTAILFIRRETVERDQSPPHVVRALVRQEVADEMAAAPGDDAAPVLGVLLERVALERVD